MGSLRNELRDRIPFGDDARNVSLDAAHDANLVDVEQMVHDGGDEVADADRFGGGVAAIAVRAADHLPHSQTAAIDEERSEVAPVITAALPIDAWRTAH